MNALSVDPGLDRESPQNGWRTMTRALLGGLIASSFMFFLIATTQPAGLDPPPESAALFLVVTTAGVSSFLLMHDGATTGYPAAMLTGGIVFVVLGLILAGTYGPAGARTNPIGPISYAVLAGAVIVSAGIAWRDERMLMAAPDSSSTS